MKRSLLAASILSFSATSAFATPTQISEIIFNQTGIDQEQQALYASASTAAYGHNDEVARILLDDKKFSSLNRPTEIASYGFRAEAFEAEDDNQVVLSFRGTEPSLAQNLLSDAAIMLYSAQNQQEKPWTYLRNHAQIMLDDLAQAGHVDPNGIVPYMHGFLSILGDDPDATVHKAKVGASVAIGGGAGALAASAATLATGGTILLVAAPAVALWKVADGTVSGIASKGALINAANAAYTFADKTIEGYDRPVHFETVGHSLGGFLANTTTELNPKITRAVTFNAPGGVAAFLSDARELVLNPGWFGATWTLATTDMTPLFAKPSKSDHIVRNQTINITRNRCVVGRVGEDDTTRWSIHVPNLHLEGTQDVATYLLKNHGVRELAADIHPEALQH